ncbi:MAG: sensor histidine kinase [Chloroflexota bacterium]
MTQPRLLNVYRLLALYWLARWSIAPWLDVWRGLDPWFSWSQRLWLIGLTLLVLALLWLPSLPVGDQLLAKIGRFYLPLIIGLSLVPLLLEKYWQLQAIVLPGVDVSDRLFALNLQQDFVLPLVIVAWQYRWRNVVVYTVLITAVEWSLISFFSTSTISILAPWPEDYLGRAIVYLIIGYSVNWLVEQQRAQQTALENAHQQQQVANQKLARYATAVEQLATSHERNRLARELHDTLAHSLSALAVQLSAVRRLWSVNPEKAQSLLAQAETATRTGLDEARGALRALRATPLETFGLIPALQQVAELAAQRGDWTLTCQLPQDLAPLPKHIEQAIYRIAQEALENVVRHAQATAVSLSVVVEETAVLLTVEDNGRGFDVVKAIEGDSFWGIAGMRERAAMLGGTCEIATDVGEGTKVVAELPI